MLMDSTNCETGDKVTLASNLNEFKSLHILEFTYYINFGEYEGTADLVIYAFYTLNGLWKEFLLSVGDENSAPGLLEMKPKNRGISGWKYRAILLPTGTYYIGFEGVCGVPYESDIGIDDIQVTEAKANSQLKNGTTMGIIGATSFAVSVDNSYCKNLRNTLLGSCTNS